MAAQARAWLEGRLVDFPGGRLLRLDGEVHPALLRRSIRAICGEIGYERLNAVEALADARRCATEIARGLYAERGRLGLYFLRRKPSPMREMPLSLEGKTCLSGICTVAARAAAPVPVRDDPARQALDADALSGAMLRTRRDGDRIRPLGCGDKLLSDYFIDRKVDRPLRDATPLIAVGGRVHWVCGHGISQDAALSPGCDAVALKFEWEI